MVKSILIPCVSLKDGSDELVFMPRICCEKGVDMNKYYLKPIIFFLSLSFVTSSALADYSTAHNAFLNGDYAIALKNIQGGRQRSILLQAGRYVLQRRGVQQDLAEGIKWCQQSARVGNMKAQYELGNLYYLGKDTSGKPFQRIGPKPPGCISDLPSKVISRSSMPSAA